MPNKTTSQKQILADAFRTAAAENNEPGFCVNRVSLRPSEIADEIEKRTAYGNQYFEMVQDMASGAVDSFEVVTIGVAQNFRSPGVVFNGIRKGFRLRLT